MAKKITAPHSYDPGKGRPKEYLAYLNEREMAYLRSINGNNMERGPRGLPSFPPEDAVGSSSKAGSTKSTTSSGAGRDSPRGVGQGAGGSAIGRGPSGSSPSGGNLGGGGKGPGGPSGPNSGPSRSGSPSTGGGGKGPGGPSGPNSAPSGTRGVGGPSSPMGGQGPSFSRDTKAQQDAQVRDAIKAVKNSPAFRNDASSGGIRTLNVGPIGTPVNVGPRVAPTQNRTSGPNNYNNIVTGGGGVMAYGAPMPKAPTRVSPTITPQKQFYERIAPGATPSTSISSQFPSYKYDSPLTPGMTPEDMTRRGALMDQYEREIRDIMRGTPTSTGDPRRAGGVPTVGRPSSPTYSGGDFNQENEAQQAAVDRAISASIAARDVAPKKTPTSTPDRSFSNSFISSAAAATPGSVDLRGAGYGTFNVPKSAQIDAELSQIERELNAPSMEEERILEVANYPERPTYPAGTWTQSYDVPSKPAISKKEQRALDMQNQYLGLDERPYAEPSEKTLDRLNEVFKENGLRPSGKTRGIGGGEPSFNNEFSGIESSGEIVRDGEFGYPTNADGSPITAEDIANMPEDIQKEYFDKVRYSRNYDTPYPLTKAEKEKGFVAGVVTSPIRRGPVGALLKGLKYVPGGLGDAAENLSNPRKAVNEYDRLDPLKKQQMRERAGKGRGFGGGSTSTTSPGGGITDIGSGGKNEPPRISPVEKETPKPPAQPKEGGPRPSIYYKWDLGVDVPSPTDSDYTLYLKYLQEKAAAKAGFA